MARVTLLFCKLKIGLPVNRWLSIRFNLLSCGIITATAAVCLITPGISASLAGFALAFANTITGDMLFMVRRFVGLEQSMVALERVKEYTELVREPAEFIEPRPPASWPSSGAIECQDLVIRYAVGTLILTSITLAHPPSAGLA